MGSRIMHSIIAYKIAESVSISDKTSFLLGGIAPDAVSPKDVSHFFTGDVDDYSREVDYENFIEKYSSVKNSSFILGYYSHLIADDLWLKGFYLPWLKNRLENDQKILNLYHGDFQMLNGLLLDYYGVTDELKETLESTGSVIEIDEVPSEDIYDFVPYVLDDMKYDIAHSKQQLNVFTFEQIIGYIETSVQKGIMHIKPILS
ncbi:hydrolase [Paenisporosarcina quisquiliarum]|uniref:Hydrolase n=1 Tax=Paenisporosarcina quisquiliarum TaxID=365346 RepID=A0A9X3LI32_9BACL|nr:hydrolase [Paenisporosarcina quisquiliarum]MCZ8537760.1 hydrolase [Paenisporosarcina quisquiliarum]